MTYATTVKEILAVRPAVDRHRELVRRSDHLLQHIEALNLRAYGALRLNGQTPPDHLEACRLTRDLVAAVNELLAAVGLEARRLRTTADALEGIFDAQEALFGTLDDAEDP